jgi:protocatechuate 3,4-dioxygenase alpha subunit
MTPSQTAGPFLRLGLAWLDGERLVDPAAPGALRIWGRVLDGAGEPVPDACVEIWQADAAGRFSAAGFGRSLTDTAGRFRFVTVKPAALPSPAGPEAPHLDVSVFARGLLQRLVTRLYFPDEAEANAADPVLRSIADEAARRSLLAVAQPDGGLRFDIHLQGPEETAFFAY